MALFILRFVLVLCAFTAGDLPAQTANEYQLKAAFLYNFAKFVEKPPEVFKNSAEPISICIFGKNPFGHLLDDTVRGKLVDNRPFVILKVTDSRLVGACRIFFISASERKSFASLLTDLKGSGALTVGEMDGFAAQGGVVNFKLEDGKVHIEINVHAAHLRISSKLLSLAQIVKCK